MLRIRQVFQKNKMYTPHQKKRRKEKYKMIEKLLYESVLLGFPYTKAKNISN